jgi:hypothetical protein
VANKEKRYNKTEISIAGRWATNCAIQIIPDRMKETLFATDKIKSTITELRDWFIDIDRAYMLDNMDETIIPITDKNEFEVDCEIKEMVNNLEVKKQNLKNQNV